VRPATRENMEAHLYEAGGWVTAEYLMDFWSLPERGLRRRLAGVAVAGPLGYIHSYWASKDDVEAYCGPKQGHAVSELRNIRDLRRNHRNRHRPPPFEIEPVTVQPELLT
jgi:hypothetical protein